MLKTRIEHAQSQVRRRRRRGLSRDWRKFGEKWRGSKAAAALSEVDGPPLSYRMTAEDRPPIYLSAVRLDI